MSKLRTDHTDYLIHWTKGTIDDAFDSLASIAIYEKIYGSTLNIKSNQSCICFSEAPAEHFHEKKGGLKPFGIKVSKQWLFNLGGRPVIYQPKEDYSKLSNDLKWKHVSYNPNNEEYTDFTWQREWRILGEFLELPIEEVSLVIPDEKYRKALALLFKNENSARGLASCDPYGYGAYYPTHPSNAAGYSIEVIKVK